MTPGDFEAIGKWAEHVSIITLLVVILVMLHRSVVKGDWVPGFEYRNRIAERDKAAELLAVSVKTTERQAEIIEALTEQIQRFTAGWRPPRQ